MTTTPPIAINVDFHSIMTKELVVVVGPTAIGKTRLAIALAQRLKTSIISADSRQFFKEMSIGTAVPSKKELEAAPHYFIQHKSIHESYSVGDFEKEGLNRIDELFKTKDKVILVGGSGLYIKAIVAGLDAIPDVDPSIRKELNNTLSVNGLDSLVQQLKACDPGIIGSIDPQNPRRVIRALEVVLSTGQSLSTFQNKPKNPRPFNIRVIGLKANRDELYQRIESRVDRMISDGLVDEVKGLCDYKHLNALQTVGYRELFDYFMGKKSLEEAILQIKQNSRRFAKRQMTWFGNQLTVNWYDYKTPEKEIFDNLFR